MTSLLAVLRRDLRRGAPVAVAAAVLLACVSLLMRWASRSLENEASHDDSTVVLLGLALSLAFVMLGFLLVLAIRDEAGDSSSIPLAELLPLSRWKAGLAHLVASVLLLGPSLVALSPCPTFGVSLHGRGYWRSLGLLENPASLLFGAGILGAWGAASTLLASAGPRGTVGRALAGVVLTAGPGYVLVALLNAWRLHPTHFELAPVLMAHVVAQAGFALLVLERWPAVAARTSQRTALVGAFGVASLAVAVGTAGALRPHWERLGGEPILELGDGGMGTTTPALALLEVRGARSGHHYLLADVTTGDWHDLGRELQVESPAAAWHSKGWEERPAITDGVLTLARMDHSRPSRRLSISTVDATSGVLPALRHVLDFDAAPAWTASPGSLVRAASFGWTAGGSLLVHLEADCGRPAHREPARSKKGSSRKHVVSMCPSRISVRDVRGRLLRTIGLPNVRLELALGRDGRALAWNPHEGAASDAGAAEHVLIDVASGRTWPFRTGGVGIAASPDLSRWLVLHAVREGLSVRRSLHLLDVIGGREHEVLGEDDLPESAQAETAAREASSGRPLDGAGHARPLHVGSAGNRRKALGVDLVIDAELSRVAWLRPRLDGDSRRFTLDLIDVESGARRTLLDEDDLPSEPLLGDSEAPVARLIRFTHDGSLLLLLRPPELLAVDVESSSSRVLARDVMHRDFIHPSPSARHVALFRYLGRERRGLFLASNGSERLVANAFRSRQAAWLDDDRLLVIAGDRAFVVNAASPAPPLTIFEPP